MNSKLSIHAVSRRLTRGLVLAGVVSAFSLAGISAASAQATTGSVFGKAPAGYAVSVRSVTTGAGRTVHADASGRYIASALPIGTYTVTLKDKDQAIAKHLNVPVSVGRNAEVDFDCSKLKCGEDVAAQ